MTAPFHESCYAALCVAKKGAPVWGEEQVKQVLREQFALATKERKRGVLHPEAKAVFNAYPRRQGGEAALTSISKAIAQDGLERVLAGTTEYASAVARWSYARKVSQSGSSLIPLPTTWFGNRCYLDDPKFWWEGTGKADKDEKESLLLAEPEGWRFAHPESRNVRENIAWSAIDTSTQKWIIANTPAKAHTA